MDRKPAEWRRVLKAQISDHESRAKKAAEAGDVQAAERHSGFARAYRERLAEGPPKQCTAL